MLVSVEATKLQIFEAISESEPAKHVARKFIVHVIFSFVAINHRVPTETAHNGEVALW